MTDWLTVNAALRPDYVRNKESPMFLRKISLKIACRLAIKIETVSGPPPRDVFLTAGARAYQKHVLHGPETVSIFVAQRTFS